MSAVSIPPAVADITSSAVAVDLPNDKIIDSIGLITSDPATLVDVRRNVVEFPRLLEGIVSSLLVTEPLPTVKKGKNSQALFL